MTIRDYGNQDTIAAISTPVGKSGIGIVRLSGKKALAIADKIFIAAQGVPASEFASGTIHYGWVANNAQLKIKNTKSNQTPGGKPEIIDEVLLTVIRAPKTYTREDIVEINCHSGIVVLKMILEAVLKQGARLAQAGEFTKRAFLNGRIDLVQAESVLDVINSKSNAALNAALQQLQGGFSQKLSRLRQNILEIMAQLEATIDFSDQDISFQSQAGLLNAICQVAQEIKKLLDTADQGVVLREGVSCVICGRPNVGKSSLLNALLRRDRAIVTAIAGTTRDALEETVDLQGIPFKLVDTAGIIQGRNAAERAAVGKSRTYIQQADIILLVLDASQKINVQDNRIAKYIASRCGFIVLNKIDLKSKVSLAEAEAVLPGRKVLPVCALSGKGLSSLEKELSGFVWGGKAVSQEEVLVTNIRHKQALQKALRLLQNAIKSTKSDQGAEIVAFSIRRAGQCLEEIAGKLVNEDVLERIFGQFCIGK